MNKDKKPEKATEVVRRITPAEPPRVSSSTTKQDPKKISKRESSKERESHVWPRYPPGKINVPPPPGTHKKGTDTKAKKKK